MTDEGNQDPNAGSGNGDGKSGNPDPNQNGDAGAGQGAGSGEGKWYSGLDEGLRDHPAITKFETPSALAKSYLEAEKFISYDKVIKPKSPEDLAGWAKFNEAMGVPKEPTKYYEKFTDPQDAPEGMGFDKEKFAKAVHDMGLRPEQAAKAWDLYTNEFISGHKAAVEAHQEGLNASETALRKEWGQAYDQNVALATKFVRHHIQDQKEFERLNAKFSTDPAALKLFAKAGKEFSENAIGGFKDPGSFKLTPQQAQEEYDKIMGNPKDDYYSDINSVRQRRIKYVESLVEQGADPMKVG